MSRTTWSVVIVLLGASLAGAGLTSAGPAEREVTFVTSDGIRIAATLFGRGATGVVLAHMRGGSRDNWFPFARSLVREGYAVLTVDFRGHGKSGGPFDSNRLDRDVGAASVFLRGQGAQRVALIGASMGGTASIKVAAAGDAAALAVISSPMDYGAKVTKADLARITIPSLWIASAQDEPYASTVRGMYASVRGVKTLRIYPGGEHGTQLFDSPYRADFTLRLLTFLRTSVPAR